MAGYYTPGVPRIGVMTGSEHIPFDTNLAAGAASPQTGAISVAQLSIQMSYYSATTSKTPVSGTRYYRSISIDSPQTFTGIAALVGATGGTDSFIYELHDSTGALVATTTTSGTTVGTANTWQKIDFTAPYLAQAGTYFITVQLNGTTARFAALNAPTMGPILTGSTTGTFGTGAAFTAPTTYTQAVGPVSVLY